MDEDDDAPTVGWDAITAVFDRLYPDQPDPPHAAAIPHWIVGGNGPLDGISFYKSRSERTHWHLVTYGFSDLYAKRHGDDPKISGFGFELTFRIPSAEEDEPPSWAVDLLQNLARYIFQSGNGFAAGEYIDLNGPIFLQAETAITCALLVEDPEAGRIEPPNGAVQFLQLVGITKDEMTAAQRWNTAGIAGLLRERDPLLVTDLSRPNLLDDEGMQARVAEGSAAEGSSCGLLFVDTVAVESDGARVRLTLGASGLASALTILPLRIPFGNGLKLRGQAGHAAFLPGETCEIAWREADGIGLQLTAEAARAFAATVKVEAGDYGIGGFPDLTVTVVHSTIRDEDGDAVGTIG